MTAKSIIDIEVNDSQFKAFQDLFTKYQSELKKSTSAWGQTDNTVENISDTLEETAGHLQDVSEHTFETNKNWQEIGKGSAAMLGNFAEMTAAMLAQAHLFREMDRAEVKARADKKKADEETNRNLNSREKITSKIAFETKQMAVNIGQATTTLLKWASLGSIGSGLLGIGGLFGLDRLADNVSAGYRSAQGLGVTSGEQKAFALNFDRYVDPSVLGNVAEAQSDITKRWAFGSMGIANPNSMDAATLSTELLRAAKRLADTTKPEMLANVMQSRGLDVLGFTVQDLKRLKETPQAELEASIKDYKNNSGTLGLSDDTQKRWRNFSTQMSRAGAQIENVFVKGLDKLILPLTHLSEQFTKAVSDFMESPQLGEWIKKLGDGIESFARYLGTKDFHDKLEQFVSGVDLVAKEIWAIAQKLKWLLPVEQDPKKARQAYYLNQEAESLRKEQDALYRERDSLAKKGDLEGAAKVGGLAEGLGPKIAKLQRDAAAIGDGNGTWKPGDPVTKPVTQFMPSVANATDEDQLVDRIYTQESSRGKNAGYSSAGALGPFQLMPDTAKQYGVTDRTNFEQSSKAAHLYVQDLMKKYGGDQEKVAAAYDWGPGNLDKDIRSHGDDWKTFLPQETKTYIEKVVGSSSSTSSSPGSSQPSSAPDRRVIITINNTTGGSAVASTNQQLAQ